MSMKSLAMLTALVAISADTMYEGGSGRTKKRLSVKDINVDLDRLTPIPDGAQRYFFSEGGAIILATKIDGKKPDEEFVFLCIARTPKAARAKFDKWFAFRDSD